MPYIILLFSALNFLFGVIVFLRTKRERANITFLIFAVTASLWTLNNFYLRLNPDIFFLKLAYALGILVSIFGLIWIYFFLKHSIHILTKTLIIPGAFFIFYLTLFTDNIIRSLTSIELFGYEGTVGPLFPLYSFYFGLIIVLILTLLVSHLRQETSLTKKSQIRYVLFGTISFAITSFVVSFLIPIFFSTFRYTIFDNLSFSLFLFSIGYAIIRLNLFNVRIIATELLTFTIWGFLLIRTLLSITLYDQIIDGTLLALSVFFGTLLMRSVVNEAKQKEKLEKLTLALEDANDELQKLDQAKSEFISIASHQLRAPLTIIKGYTSMILEGTMGKISQAVRDALEKTYTSGEQLIKLIASLLDLSRIESGKIRYEFKPANFVEIIQDVAGEFKANADKKGVTLAFENKAEGLPALSLDADKIREMVINFIDNAIKYTPVGKAIFVLLEKKKNGWVRLSVRDEGTGIKKEDLKKLFIKFNRTDEAHAQDPNGMGIGLYFAKRVVEDHGGFVGVESEGLGKGSTFFADLPIKIIS